MERAGRLALSRNLRHIDVCAGCARERGHCSASFRLLLLLGVRLLRGQFRCWNDTTRGQGYRNFSESLGIQKRSNAQQTRAGVVVDGIGRSRPNSALLHGDRHDVCILQESAPPLAIGTTSQYRHLGSMIACNASLLPAIRRRIGEAAAAGKPLRKHVFGNRGVPLRPELSCSGLWF